MTLDTLGIVILGKDNFLFYAAILKELPRRSFTIIVWDLCDDPQNISRTVELCQANNYSFIRASEAYKRRIRFKQVLSHQTFADYELRGLRELGDTQVRYLYGLGFDPYHFAKWNEEYDVILCYGAYQCRKLAFCNRTLKIQIGYPRYDSYFNTQKGKGELLKLFGCNPAKKTIAWLPTMGDPCSIPFYAEQVSGLSREFNVVVKPHPWTFHSKPEFMSLLERLPFTRVIKEPLDSLDLFRVADFVFADYGGSAFGALYTNRDIVLLNIPGMEDHPDVGADSSDFVLRRRLRSFDPSASSRLLMEHLEDKDYWSENVKCKEELRTDFFAPYYGYASKVAASTLVGLDIVTGLREPRGSLHIEVQRASDGDHIIQAPLENKGALSLLG